MKLYLLHGEKPFTDEQEKRVYTREEKLRAIKEVLNHNKSCRQVALEVLSVRCRMNRYHRAVCVYEIICKCVDMYAGSQERFAQERRARYRVKPVLLPVVMHSYEAAF